MKNILGQVTTLATLIITLTIIYPLQADARQWKKVMIPGAQCGSGAPYAVWIDKKSKSKLAIEFMGGGACWSAATCFGPNFRAWSFPIPRFPLMSVFSGKKSFYFRTRSWNRYSRKKIKKKLQLYRIRFKFQYVR